MTSLCCACACQVHKDSPLSFVGSKVEHKQAQQILSAAEFTVNQARTTPLVLQGSVTVAPLSICAPAAGLPQQAPTPPLGKR